MEKHLSAMPGGTRLVVLVTDPMAKVDIPLYCRQHGHSCTLESGGSHMRFDIVKA